MKYLRGSNEILEGRSMRQLQADWRAKSQGKSSLSSGFSQKTRQMTRESINSASLALCVGWRILLESLFFKNKVNNVNK